MKLFSLVSIGMCLCFYSCKSQDLGFNQFVPKGYKTIDKIYGDLNADGLQDCVLIIKGTDPTQEVINRFGKKVDRNRRGIVVLVKDKDAYQVATKNYSCFISENEDGGVYYAPQLEIAINQGLLNVVFEHGRYGHWEYSFKYQNSSLQLIAYQETRGGAIIEHITTIDFNSKIRVDSMNTNQEGGKNAVFEDHEKAIRIDRLLNFSDIDAFEDLDMSVY